MMITIFSEAARMFLRRIRVGFRGIKKYPGNAEQICSQVVRDCFNREKNYFMTSKGHFCELYARDFGWCTEALLSLGYRKEVVNTLNYELVVDGKTGLVRKDKYFSSIKDYALRQSSCYDNCMTAMLANELEEIKALHNPFKNYDYKKLIIKNFWTGSYFLDDLSGDKRVCGDANFIPFWTGLITDKAMMRKAVAAVRRDGLDKPLPLRYTSRKHREQKMIPLELIAGDYEGGRVGAHLGMMFIRVVSMIDNKLAMQYLAE